MSHDQNCFYIALQIRPDQDGGVYVSSDSVPGLHLQGRYLVEMKPRIETAIKRLFLDNRGVHVNVVWLSNAAAFPTVEDVPSYLAVYPEAA